MEHVHINDLSRMELRDFLSNQVSGHEKDVEIVVLISTFTAIKMTNSICEKFELTEYDLKELIDLINSKLNADGYDDEEFGWDLVIETIGAEGVIEIVDNVNEYMGEYLKITHQLENLERTLLELFVNKERSVIVTDIRKGCENCKHKESDPDESPCDDCLKSQQIKEWINWEEGGQTK